MLLLILVSPLYPARTFGLQLCRAFRHRAS